jgi:hypothetical protein
VRPGVTCRGATVRWERYRAGSTAGARAGFGSACCRRCKPRRRGEIDWDLHFVDATIVCAHQHAAGARRDGATPEAAQAREALGRSQGGFSTKLHLRAEGNGRPITVVLTGGQRNEQIVLEAVLDQGAVRRPGRGRPRLRPRAAACDKAYSSPTARARLRTPHPASNPDPKRPASPAQLRPRVLSATQQGRAAHQPP